MLPGDWRSYVTGIAAGQALTPLFAFVGASYLAIASFALVMAWHTGPQRLIDAHRAQAFTARTDARIVESWLAVAFDPGRMGTSEYWRGFAKASACVIVEYEGDWGSARRGFCGPRYGFLEPFTVHDLRTMAPGVAFDFARDANGFGTPEIRMGKAGLEYLRAHPAMNSFRKYSALDEMRRRLDRPDDAAIASWTTAFPTFPLAIDPLHPAQPLPAGLVEFRRNADPDWLPGVFASVVGLAFWFAGTNILLARVPFAARIFLGALPLLALPWWAEELPNALRHINAGVAETVAETLGDITASGSLASSEPADTLLHDGERIVFGLNNGFYAGTMGRLHFERPVPAPASADAALAALSESASGQVRRMNAAQRTELFDRLRAEKKDRLPHAGLIFVRAAREALLDPRGGEDARMAARAFLSEWVTSPVLDPRPGEPAFAERLAMFRELVEVPVDVIANPASWVVERAETAQKKAARK